jgi:hypothetical protein
MAFSLPLRKNVPGSGRPGRGTPYPLDDVFEKCWSAPVPPERTFRRRTASQSASRIDQGAGDEAAITVP